jgi:hypothetical protein
MGTELNERATKVADTVSKIAAKKGTDNGFVHSSGQSEHASRAGEGRAFGTVAEQVRSRTYGLQNDGQQF